MNACRVIFHYCVFEQLIIFSIVNKIQVIGIDNKDTGVGLLPYIIEITSLYFAQILMLYIQFVRSSSFEDIRFELINW